MDTAGTVVVFGVIALGVIWALASFLNDHQNEAHGMFRPDPKKERPPRHEPPE